MLSEAKKFHSYARQCLQLAEQANEPEIRKSLIELSHIWIWIEAALKEERHITTRTSPQGSREITELGGLRYTSN